MNTGAVAAPKWLRNSNALKTYSTAAVWCESYNCRFTLRAAAEQTLASAGCRGRTTDSFSSAAALNKRNHKLCVNHYISKAKFTQQAHAT